ncbi:MAG: hypothetical protein JWO06_1252 [Bacteroidota bacterium]|nr:hypothetical protein [Bacteroidota bacterium]
MKKYLLLITVLIPFIQAMGQNDSTTVQKEHPHYLSVNGTFFLKQFLNFAGSSATITPSTYILEYKFLPKNHGFRFSVGGNYTQKKNYQDSSQITVNSSMSFDFRLGYVYQKKIAKRWSVFAGADIVSHIENTFLRVNTVEDIVTTKTQSWSVGIGPSFGFQFAINKRIGLFTETAFYYMYSKGTQGHTFVNNPDFNDGTKNSGNSLTFVIPTSLFFYVRL